MTEWPRCSCCGMPLDPHRRRFDVGFELPDPVWEMSPQERAARVAGRRLAIVVEGMGSFIRVLLPVQLSDGYEIVFGCWLCVPSEQYERARKIWNQPGYDHLVLTGLLANAIKPWSSACWAPAIAKVRTADELPYVVESSDPTLSRVLREVWPHADAVRAWPKLLEGPQSDG